MMLLSRDNDLELEYISPEMVLFRVQELEGSQDFRDLI